MLRSERLLLRVPEPSDLEYLVAIENDPANWEVSRTMVPFSRHVMQEYLKGPHDVLLQKQVRFMICALEVLIGTIDLFEYDPIHQRAGVGVYLNADKRGNGYAQEALECIKIYSRDVLFIRNLHASMITDNQNSVRLFEQCGFEKVGLLRNWTRLADGWKDEYLYQIELEG